MSRPRVIIQCPLCKCVADQVFFRRQNWWRCSYCKQTWRATAPVVSAIFVSCPHHDGSEAPPEKRDDESAVWKALSPEFALQLRLSSAAREVGGVDSLVIPVTQTKFGGPDAPVEEQGNCFAACLCSLLHVPLDRAPGADLGRSDLWWPAMYAFAARHNYWLLRLPAEWELSLGPETHYIASGKSPRGDYLHSVVKRGGELVHDPHPDGGGIKTLVDVIVLVWRS